MAGEGLFDPQLVIKEWFGSLDSKDWFDDSLVSKPSGGGTSYTLTGLAGSYSLSGGTASLKVARSVTANAGTYALSGGTAVLKVARNITANAGTYGLTGGNAVVTVQRKLTGNAGAYSLSGGSATLTKSAGAVAYALTGDAGVYSLTGGTAGLVVNRSLVGDAGSYSLTGGDAVLTKTGITAYTLLADAGVYALSGGDAVLSWSGEVQVRQGGLGKLRAQLRKTETEEQKRLRREAQGIIQRIQQGEVLPDEAADVSKQLQEQIARLEIQAAQYQAELNQQRTLARMQELQSLLIAAQLQAEQAQQQIEELDVAFVMFMLAAHI